MIEMSLTTSLLSLHVQMHLCNERLNPFAIRNLVHQDLMLSLSVLLGFLHSDNRSSKSIRKDICLFNVWIPKTDSVHSTLSATVEPLPIGGL